MTVSVISTDAKLTLQVLLMLLAVAYIHAWRNAKFQLEVNEKTAFPKPLDTGSLHNIQQQ